MQNKNNYEFIIAEDGSTDKTKEIILEKQKKINFIYSTSDKRRGVRGAMLESFKIASGDYIFFADSGKKFDFNGNSYLYPDTKIVYWAGGNPFHHHQDLNRLIKAWEKLGLKDAELTICGLSKESFGDQTFPDNVKVGWVPDLVETLQQSSLFILPALEDGCPLATH